MTLLHDIKMKQKIVENLHRSVLKLERKAIMTENTINEINAINDDEPRMIEMIGSRLDALVVLLAETT